MGRAPCCDKANVKKGPWSPEEDAKLKSYIEANGTGGNWIALPQKIGLKRCGKSCRLRWLNYLRPNIKHGGFSEEEDNIICSLYISIGSRWSIIAAQLPGRTDNDIKNYWNTRLKKKLLGKQRKEQQARRVMSGLKQEMKRGIAENNNYMIPGNMVNQGQYWPQLPAVPVMPLTSTTQQDQDSIRNLLVKLGGRFSDENPVQSSTAAAAMNLRYPVEVSFGHHQDQNIYDNSMNIISPSSSLSPINSSSCSEVINSSNFNVNEAAAVAAVPNSNMFQGLDGFPTDLTELIYGLDTGFYGTDGSSTSGSGISSVESSSWGSGDINSLSYSQMASGFEACQQPNMAQVVQVSTFDESSYFGPQ